MLLVELLCFDEECDFEDPASEWSTEKIQRRLSQSAAGEHLRHLAAGGVFQLQVDRRPTSYDLARTLRMATPPRLKRRGGTLTRAWHRTADGRGTAGSSGFLATTVIILWVLCLVHWALISFHGAAWLLSSPAAAQGQRTRGDRFVIGGPRIPRVRRILGGCRGALDSGIRGGSTSSDQYRWGWVSNSCPAESVSNVFTTYTNGGRFAYCNPRCARSYRIGAGHVLVRFRLRHWPRKQSTGKA